jgi:hypothetical protein
LTWLHEIGLLNLAVTLWRATKSAADDQAKVVGLAFRDLSRARWPLSVLRILGPRPSEPKCSAERALDVITTEKVTRLSDVVNQQGIVATRGLSLSVRRGRLTFAPKTLIAAMWQQFLSAVEEGKDFRPCPARGCPVQWFEVSTGPQGVREDAEFCDARCRHVAYRDRKKQAVLLAKKGKAPYQIARELRTNSAQVEKWIRAAQTSSGDE